VVLGKLARRTDVDDLVKRRELAELFDGRDIAFHTLACMLRKSCG